MRWNRLVITGLAIIILVCGCINTTEKNLLKNSGFESVLNGQPIYWKTVSMDKQNWIFAPDNEVKRSGNTSASIEGKGDWAYWKQSFERNEIPLGKEVRVSGYIKTENVAQSAEIVIWCVDFNGNPTEAVSAPITGTKDWTFVTASCYIPEDTVWMDINLFIWGPGKVWFDDLQLIAGEKIVAGEKIAEENFNSALIKAYGSYILSQKGSGGGNEGGNMISFSPPINYESQALLGFWMESEPSGYIKEYRFEKDVGPNYIVEVDLKQPGEKIKVNWYAYVFTKAFDYSTLPENALISDLRSMPEDVKRWLEPTEAVQSDHPEIVAKAKELRGDSKDIMEIARRITNFVGREIEGRGGLQDALTTLRTGGAVCTGHANLAAALFRANGIPCRVLAVSSASQLQTHYVVEFYVPDYGWVWMESTMGIMPYQPTGVVLLRIVYPEDEIPWGVPEHTTIDSTPGICVECGLDETCYQGREILHRYCGDREEIATAYLKTKEIGERSINGSENGNGFTNNIVEECATIEDYIAFLNSLRHKVIRG